ncbi:uncharacterized protein C18orf19 homolog A [Amyelois transitella]|uniref:uncharacterized protein C18orf19 homolog A n=1 Tax=Amyelois transitella TaxID=680683 RepID=UPI00067DD23F|nr:uncharacterized protein C18orf19 homolog A [Amyelois transitella]
MAFFLRPYYRKHFFQIVTQPAKYSLRKNSPINVLTSGICYQNSQINNLKSVFCTRSIHPVLVQVRQYSSENLKNDNKEPTEETKKIKKQDEFPKPNLFQRFKQMYRDYWYVLLPVHMTTSAIWFGGFYYAVRSGVDVLAILEWMGISETLMAPLKDSSAGYFALAFALYKIATPLRYAVTVGGTTVAIKKLTAIGWIKPVPSTERIKEMLQEQKDSLQDRFKESKEHYKSQMSEKRTQVMDEMRRYKSEMRSLKNKVKKM